MRNKIIVTGGTGFIGSHTVVELMEADYQVIIIDNLSNSNKEVLKGIGAITGQQPTFYELDIRDKEGLIRFFTVHQDAVGIIHFAALKAVGESVEKPMLYYENNIVGLKNILEAAKETMVQSFIFSSSCTVYGQAKTLPVNESTPFQQSASPYGNTKQLGEYLLNIEATTSEKLSVIALRYFNPIGCHQSTHIGELPNGIPPNLMPYVTQTAAGIRKELKIFGHDYETHDGTAIRDYIHVVDLAKAHRKALDRLIARANKQSFETYNIGTGIGYSVLDVIHSFEKMNNVKVPYSFAPRREGDIEAIYADPNLAKKELDWEATYSLDDMTKSSWQWQQKINKI